MNFNVTYLRSDQRPLSYYQDTEHVPYALKERLTRAQCEPFLASDKGPVTFTVAVPLDFLACGEPAQLEQHIEQTAFEFPVEMRSCEFRAVGVRIEDFDQAFCGQVHLQVTCELHLREA